MRICFIDASTGTLTGGSESIIYSLGCELAKRHEVGLITGSTPVKEMLPHIKHAPWHIVTVPYICRLDPRSEDIRSRFRLPLKFDLEAISLFIHFLLSPEARRYVCSCDVVSMHYPTTSLVFSRYLQFKGIPSVFHTPGHVTGKWFFKYDRSTLYLGNSHDTEQKIFWLTGRHADGVVIPGIAYPGEYPRKPSDVEHPRLLCVSRLSRAKGVYRLLKIFAHLVRELPGVQLLCVGQNYEGEKLFDLAKSLGVVNNLRLVGQVPYTEMGAYYSQADLLVHPSFPESFGMVLLEAMSYGLPVVATNLGCFREATQGVALFMPFGDSDEWPDDTYQFWAREILSLLRDNERRAWMSEAGKRIALESTWDKQTAEYERYLHTAIECLKGKK